MDDLLEMVDQELRIDRLLEQGLSPFCENWSQICANFFRANATVLLVAQATAPTSAHVRAIFTSRQDESLCRYERFVELGQLAKVIRSGDNRAIAKLLLINNQNWNHPYLHQAEVNDTLYQEMTQHMVQLLKPTS